MAKSIKMSADGVVVVDGINYIIPAKYREMYQMIRIVDQETFILKYGKKEIQKSKNMSIQDAVFAALWILMGSSAYSYGDLITVTIEVYTLFSAKTPKSPRAFTGALDMHFSRSERLKTPRFNISWGTTLKKVVITAENDDAVSKYGESLLGKFSKLQEISVADLLKKEEE